MLNLSKNEILSILKETRRDGIFYSDDVKKRVLANKVLTPALTALCNTADELDKIADEPLSFSLFRRYVDDGNRSEYESKYFTRRRKLLVYGIKSWLYDNNDDLVKLCDVMWSILDEYSWSLPAHLGNECLEVLQTDVHTVDLFAAETAEALTEIVALLGEKISPIIRKRIRFEVERRIFTQLHRKFFWKRTTINWAAVCAGCVGMTAIFDFEDNDALADILVFVFSCMRNFLSGFSKDGVCLEGIAYWDYGFGYFMNFAELLKRRTEGKINLFEIPEVRKIADFYPAVFFAGGRTVSFSDSHVNGKMLPGIVSLLLNEYPDFVVPSKESMNFEYFSDHCGRFASSIRHILYMRDDIDTLGKNVSTTYVYPDAQWFISTATNGVSVAAKAGHNDEPHNHNDVGSFLVYKNGEQIISDIGCGEYTKQYFSSERYTIFCNSSRSHSVPVINGNYQLDGSAYTARNTVITDEGLTTDISGAYNDKTLKSLIREIKFNKQNGETVIRDSFEFDIAPESVTECFITSSCPQISNGYVRINQGKESMDILFDNSKFIASTEKVVDIGHHGDERTTYIVKFESLIKATDLKFEFKII